MIEYKALANKAINIICAEHFCSKDDTLDDMAAPITLAACETEKHFKKLKTPSARMLFFLRCIYAVGLQAGMLGYRVALAAALNVPEEEFDERFRLPDFSLEKNSVRRIVNLLNNCSVEDLKTACYGLELNETTERNMQKS